MKKLVLLLLAISTFSQSRGQVELQDGQNLMLIPVKENNVMNTLSGTPYLQEDFVLGTVFMEGKEPLKVFMRYDVHQEQIEIKTEPASNEVFWLPKKKNTEYLMGTKRIILDELVHEGKRIVGYFVEHYDGDKFRLVEKPVVTIDEAVKAKTGYDKDQPAKIVIEEEFYIIDSKGEIKNVRLRHRDIKKAFDSSNAKNYLSENKIRSEEDLVNFISYLDKQ